MPETSKNPRFLNVSENSNEFSRIKDFRASKGFSVPRKTLFFAGFRRKIKIIRNVKNRIIVRSQRRITILLERFGFNIKNIVLFSFKIYVKIRFC